MADRQGIDQEEDDSYDYQGLAEEINDKISTLAGLGDTAGGIADEWQEIYAKLLVIRPWKGLFE